MNPKVKICGITDADGALWACEAGADALGFNFSREAISTNRYIDPEKAQRIVEELPPFVTTVGVTVNESVSALRGYLEFVDVLQLHGEEPPECCAGFESRVIKAFRVDPSFQVEDILKYPAAAYLLDAYVAGKRGGTGKTFQWEIAREAVAAGKPIILAGGLRPENVAEAIRCVRPYAVDTATGVESAPGKKDRERIFEFVQNAKSALS